MGAEHDAHLVILAYELDCFTVVSVRWEFRRFDPRKSEIADSKNDVSLEMESAYKYLERLVC